MRSLSRHSQRRLPAIALLIGLWLTAGCQQGASGASPPGASSAASPSSAPSVTFAWDGKTPAVTTALAGLQEKFVNPGAVIESGGRLHMFANVFSHWPGKVAVVHLVSSDGMHWTAPEPAFTSEQVPFASPGADASTGYVTDDGTWVLILTSVSSTEPWVIGRATAPGPDGPWTIDPTPILLPGASGSPDSGGLSWPSVVRSATGWSMYYTGTTGPGKPGAIMLATSPDGKQWTKHGQPVLSASETWEKGGLDRPRVAVTPRGLVMVYSGRVLTDRGLAWSSDGLTWTRDGDRPVLTREDFPIDASCWDAALLFTGGSLAYYLEIGTSSGSTSVFRATAQLPAG